MNISLRQKIANDLFDYAQLTDALSGYGNIRAKIGRLLASGEVIRMKKGLYTFPEYLRKAPLNSCVIANMMYGPSYVSCDYALAYYGMIPERVEWITSMTMGRPREFVTPVGNFAYFQRNAADYPIGIDGVDSASGSFLIATKEKAIYDKALTDKRFDGATVENYLFEDLRLEPDTLTALNQTVLLELQVHARGRMLKLLKLLLERWR